jgi:hypothetical protein
MVAEVAAEALRVKEDFQAVDLVDKYIMEAEEEADLVCELSLV